MLCGCGCHHLRYVYFSLAFLWLGFFMMLTLVLFLTHVVEERPGHDLKLHQYSSSDIRDIIQRQLRVR